MQVIEFPEKSLEDQLEVLKAQLLSDDPAVRGIAAACIRTGQDIIDTARRTNTWVVSTIDGEIVQVPPDSPLLPDYSELLALANRVAPKPPGLSLDAITVRTQADIARICCGHNNGPQ
jgi:hypothetical protein